MKFSIVLLIMFSIISCNKKHNEEIVCGSKTFIFFDKNGNDLFDKNTMNHLSTDELQAHTPEGKILNIKHIIYENKNYFDIELNGLKGEGITFLKLGTITIDTIFVKSKEKGNSIFISELYYNNVLLEINKSENECDSNNPKSITVISD